MSSPSDLVINVVTISSLEIASLTGRLHKNIMVDIRDVKARVAGRGSSWLIIDESFIDAQGKPRNSYRVSRNVAMVVAAKYSIDLRISIADKLDELETKSNLSNLQLEARKAFTTYLSYYTSLGYSTPRAKQLSARDVNSSFGIDLSPDINLSLPNLSIDDIYLNPTEISRIIFSNAIQVNRLLAELNLQFYKDGRWYPSTKALDLGISKPYEYVRSGGRKDTALSWNSKVVIKMFSDAGYHFSKVREDVVPSPLSRDQAASMSLLDYITRSID